VAGVRAAEDGILMNSDEMVIGHDYLIQMGGAERVVASMLRKWPRSPVYTSAARYETLLPEFRDAAIYTSWMQRLPGMDKHFKKFFALYPAAFRSFGVIDAPVAWVSASTFAKCLRFTPRTASILYCHNPTRFLWQAEEYVDHETRSRSLSAMVNLTAPALRGIDRAAARAYDVIVANSENVRSRIAKCYGRDAELVYPPVDVDRFEVSRKDDGFYLVVSRLVAYKSIQRAIEACNALGRKLVIVGNGPDRNRLLGMAGPTVEFKGHVPDAEVRSLMERCKAFIFPGEEDFGITPVEAAACGKPVLAFKGGGALETVIEGETGHFFDQAHTTLMDAMLACEATPWNPDRIRANAERFSEARFHDRIGRVVLRALEAKDRVLAGERVEVPGMDPVATSGAV
jgi:glycosyltransferase involved in cell wall biosynthesis